MNKIRKAHFLNFSNFVYSQTNLLLAFLLKVLRLFSAKPVEQLQPSLQRNLTAFLVGLYGFSVFRHLFYDSCVLYITGKR